MLSDPSQWSFTLERMERGLATATSHVDVLESQLSQLARDEREKDDGAGALESGAALALLLAADDAAYAGGVLTELAAKMTQHVRDLVADAA